MSPALPAERRWIDLASAALGGQVIHANDEFFAPAANLLRPEEPEWREGEYTDRGKWMDGWETRRRREPGQDHCIVALGVRGTIRRARIETTHFRGNQPEACSLHAVDAGRARSVEALPPPDAWRSLLDRAPLDPDAVHELDIADPDPATHVRLTIHPDGGVARLRLFGDAVPPDASLETEGPFDLAALVNGGLPVAVSDETFGEPQNLLLPEPAAHMGEGWETRRRRGPGHDWVVIRLGRRGAIAGIRLETHHFKGNYPAAASIDACDVGPEAGEALPPDDAWRPLLERTPLRPDATHQWIGELLDPGSATHVRLNIFPDGGVARLRVFGRPLDAA